MTSTTRTTLKSTNERIDGLENKLDAILAHLTGNQVEAPATPALTVPTVVGEVVKVTDETTGVSFRDLRTALKAHKAAGAIRAGITVKEAIAEGLMDEYGNLGTGVSPVKVEVVVAETVTEAPAKPRTPAQIAAAERLASAPRRADGTITPESEWVAREALAETGKFDRFEIDAFIADLGADVVLETLTALATA